MITVDNLHLIYLIILSIKFYIVFIYLFLRLRAFRMYLNDLDLD